jgi:hypothetical protein
MLRIFGRRRSLHIIHDSDDVLRAAARRRHGKKRRSKPAEAAIRRGTAANLLRPRN